MVLEILHLQQTTVYPVCFFIGIQNDISKKSPLESNGTNIIDKILLYLLYKNKKEW